MFETIIYLTGFITKHHQLKNSQKTREINSGQAAPSQSVHKRVGVTNSNGSSKSVTKIISDAPADLTKNKSGQLNRTFDSGREGAKSSNSCNFSDLESTKIDFDETATS